MFRTKKVHKRYSMKKPNKNQKSKESNTKEKFTL